jgi:hypothetical protein
MKYLAQKPPSMFSPIQKIVKKLKNDYNGRRKA